MTETVLMTHISTLNTHVGHHTPSSAPDYNTKLQIYRIFSRFQTKMIMNPLSSVHYSKTIAEATSQDRKTIKSKADRLRTVVNVWMHGLMENTYLTFSKVPTNSDGR